jgi:cytochrome P450
MSRGRIAGIASLAALPGPHLTRVEVRGLDLVAHLLSTAAEHPDPVVAHAVESFFAPHMDTIGCVGVRGASAIREVLTNSSDYGPLQPDLGDLPADVRGLSRGVFTFDGPSHAQHRSGLRDLIALDDSSLEIMRTAVAEVIRSWHGRQLDLMVACRDAARDIWSAVLFGPGSQGRIIGRGVQEVVDGRRARRLATTTPGRRVARRQTIRASRALTATLGDWLGSTKREGLLAGLGTGIDDDDAKALAIAHATALCAASTEPAASSLAWAILALTQRFDLQAEIRATLVTVGGPVNGARNRSRDVLERVLLETQRLLPSSAIVTRATLRTVEVAGHVVPENCEVMISSLLAHRDRSIFPEPARFVPERWHGLKVTPFEFFPFGAGVRGCLGATVAHVMLKTTLAELLANSTVRLAFDTRIGWQMPDALMPTGGVPILVGPPDSPAPPGRAEGPITDIVDFGSFDLDAS